MKKTNRAIIRSMLPILLCAALAGCSLKTGQNAPEPAKAAVTSEAAGTTEAAKASEAAVTSEATGTTAAAGLAETTEAAASPLMDMKVYELSGQESRLGNHISGNKVTMLNFWGTFCGPCIMEMPSLGELERQYKDRGFEILGLTVDILDRNGKIQDGPVRDAEAIMADTGISYPVLIADMELLIYGNITAVPTTYFVDAQGKLLGSPVIGSQSKEAWEKLILAYLEQAE